MRSWLYLVAVVAVVGGGAPVARASEACFRTHLDEAIALNTERMPRYAALSNGDTTAISLALIGFEMVSLYAADALDARAEVWERAGVAVVCDAFVPMSLTPPFVDAVEPPRAPFEARDGALLAVRLGWAYAWHGEERLAAAIERELAALAAAPGQHCMLRHILESILRAAYLAPMHADQARALGLPSPAALSRDLIAAQLASLPIAAAFDRAAAPVQARGIPILCQDVPPIALP